MIIPPEVSQTAVVAGFDEQDQLWVETVAALGRAALAELKKLNVQNPRTCSVKLSLKKGIMVLSASSPENGSASEELEIRYDGPPIEIGFNARYLLDITTQLQGDEAEFKLADAASPTLLGDPADPTALYVLMPMRV